ncbi:heme NO-binding domain-containing protein [Roseovarius sp. SCSIO 43702]|uniref:heme NO-binding domain-containing protein n=1 Tax=Roseovarius sp. SCSIO 43702 TaxID=2823043 RepID=UPI001C72AC8C|nr:heme NO-binding domain-containing protein [Roseovarius sp. SCSIO 43702]QYX57929.1 heme NO-binding domain-containing protein [Roseovarius sp. SCSIO 43702]
MHGMINRAVERFVRDTYGRSAWGRVTQRAALGFSEFEAMLSYDDALTDRVIAAASAVLGKPRDEMLEDIGTYLVSHPNVEALRRLLRFGGVDFPEFLHSLDELPGRARLAVPDLVIPDLDLREHGAQFYTLRVRHEMPGFGHVIVGLLRAMADDYGALVMLDHKGRREGCEVVEIRLLSVTHAEGRSFALSAGAM